jgi:hypothetical protein
MSPKSVQTTEGQSGSTTGSILTVSQRSITQLVAVCMAHQTKHAANSIKTRTNPQDSNALETMECSDRQHLHAQMAEVVRRAGTSVERNTRWRSQTAPGTRGPDELLHLTGNSANAEVVAKERVNMVRRSS